jgi:hypothetical protein
MSKSARGLLALVCGAAVLLVFAGTPATASAQPSPFQRGPERYVWVGPGSGLPPADLALIRDRVTDLFGSLPEVVVAPQTEPERQAIVSSGRLGRELLQISWTASTVPNDPSGPGGRPPAEAPRVTGPMLRVSGLVGGPQPGLVGLERGSRTPRWSIGPGKRPLW